MRQETITDCLYIITVEETYTCDFYTNEKNTFLTVKSTLRLIFIGIILNDPLIKYRKVSIYASFHKSKQSRTLVIVMKPFCGKSNLFFHMGDCIMSITLIAKDLSIILWLN